MLQLILLIWLIQFVQIWYIFTLQLAILKQQIDSLTQERLNIYQNIQQLRMIKKDIIYTLQASPPKSYFSQQQNAFLNPNITTSVMKTITSILLGERIKQNQTKLHQLRKQPQYPLILCQLLTKLHKTTLMQQNPLQTNKKNFILLQIKKNINRLKNQQCWWLMRDVYFSDNDKTAKMVREIVIAFEKCISGYNRSDSNGDMISSENNYLSIFFTVNLQNQGLVGLVRYLVLVHSLLVSSFSSLSISAITKYGQMIVKKIVQTLEWDLPTYVVEFSLTCLVMLYGFLIGNQKCWGDRRKLGNVLDNILQKKRREQNGLINILVKYLVKQLHLTSITQITENNISKQQEQLESAIKHCLSQTRDNQLQSLPSQKLFYVDCISILDSQWRKDIKLSFNHSNQNSNIQQSNQHFYRIIQLYKLQFTSSQGSLGNKNYSNNNNKDRKWLISNEQDDDTEDKIIKQKRNSILISIFQLIPHNQLFNIILNRDSFMLLFMHLSTHCQQIRKYHAIDVESCLNLLSCALREDSDTYLFYKQKGQMVDVVIRYIARYYKEFNPQLLLKASYLLDLLAHKCESISQQCYQLLTIFPEQLQHCYASDLIGFIEVSLQHINGNDWQQTANCYEHVIKLVVGIDPEMLFDTNFNNNINILQQQKNHNHKQSIFPTPFQSTANHMQKLILKMVQTIISSLKLTFNYQQMHSLNTILQYLMNNNAQHIMKQLTYQDVHFIVKTNFTFQILTTQSADVYFYFTLFSQQKQIFINSVNLYQFWQLCESQKLQFFVHVYLKLIHPSKYFFTSSQIDHKLNQLKKNLWHRFVSENDQEERDKIVSVFQKHPEQLSSLFQEYHKIMLWGQNKNTLYDRDNFDSYGPPKMELQ